MRASLCFVLLLLAHSAAQAQWSGMKLIDAPSEPDAIPLGTGGIVGALAAESWFTFNNQATARNIQQATLTPILPAKEKATGAAVVIAPGGGFLMLSMETEGWPVAQWLADHGVAAFILKYRLHPTPPTIEAFQRDMGKLFSSAGTESSSAPTNAIEDGEAALRMVRANARSWGVDPVRVGMLGFSAGAMTTLGVALKATSESMPAFIAPIYGPMAAVTVPTNAPPMFVVLAADDPLFANKGFSLINSWMAARKPIEFHLYQKGGHGFGMGKSKTTTTQWIERFHEWLEMNGFLQRQQ